MSDASLDARSHMISSVFMSCVGAGVLLRLGQSLTVALVFGSR